MEENKNYIPMEKCKDGWLYRIDARNANLGIYNATKKTFYIRRDKWGFIHLFEEYHWDTGEPYGTAKPLEEIEFAGNFNNDDERLAYLIKKFVDDKNRQP